MTSIISTTMLSKLKQLLGITGNEQDPLLQLVLQTVNDEIVNYCNLDQMPILLENVAVRMAADMWRSERYGVEHIPPTAKSVSRGDVSTSFDTKPVADIRGVKDIVDNYKVQLQAFRKLRW
ncbi:phage head-tail connector protein [Paenibacillus sp. SC116]|uniref:phage head-tail connector protein n=1 Tax=Paenibacillus sp. SC116 TaxID=2968986 RepID=UPI00215B3F5C|nr:phage head-tail connector protein [Paenibacillus sp. SC116]MCR8844063.1 phage head-tail connector protein [Paenibacillus sp. SC116]